MRRKSNAARKGDVVTLPRGKYEALLERLDDLEDALALRRAKAENDPRDNLPVELVERLIAGEHPLRIWRAQRGLTLQALSRKSGVGLSYISEIEGGKKNGSADALKKLASALGLQIDDVVR